MSPARWIVVAIGLAPAALVAEPLHIEPGLWEIAYSYALRGEPPAAALDKLAPEKRAEVEKSWAARVGHTKSGTSKRCVTADQIADGTAFENEPHPAAQGCDRVFGTRTASRLTLVEHCSSVTGTAERNVQINARGPRDVQGSMNAVRGEGDAASGIEMTFRGKWLAKSCGGAG